MHLFLLVFLVGVIGWIWFPLLFRQKEPFSITFENIFRVYLAGFAVSSLLLFLLNLLGIFSIKWFWLLQIAAAIATIYLRIWIRNHRALMVYLVFCSLIGLFALGINRIQPAFETLIMGDDASVYVATGIHLARTGSTTYVDPVFQAMTPAEQEIIFINRAAWDTSGYLTRFPGGVRFVDFEEGKVGFGFYHLLPVWIAFSFQMTGEEHFLSILSLFSALSLVSLYCLAVRYSNRVSALFVPILLFVFYPQIYFARTPSSELLGQALFLSGLWVVLDSFGKQVPRARQLQAGLLWGCMFLTRIDLMVVVSISAFSAFVFSRRLRSLIPELYLLWGCLTSFIIVAFMYQIYHREYLYVNYMFGQIPFLYKAYKHLSNLSLMINRHPVITFAVFIPVLLLWLMILKKWMDPERSQGRRWIVAGGFLNLSLLAIIVYGIISHGVLNTAQWLNLYLPIPVAAGLIACGAISLSARVKDANHSEDLILVSLFVTSSVFYLLSPLVSQYQPWAMRRFVPLFFPLLFLLAVSGLHLLLRYVLKISGDDMRAQGKTEKVQNNKQKAVWLLHTAACIAAGSALFYSSRILFLDEFTKGTAQQIKKLSEKIPHNALLLLPHQMSWFHLQLPMQYLHDRDTLVLGVRKRAESIQGAPILQYLRRQVEQRPVYMLLINSPNIADHAYAIANNFKLQPVFKQTLRMQRIEWVPVNQFPGKIEDVTLNCAVFRLGGKRNPAIRSEIAFNDPDVLFAGFHEPEGRYRWTSSESELSGFEFDTAKSKIQLKLETVEKYIRYDTDTLNLNVQINEGTPAKFIGNENGEFHFSIDGTMVSTVTRVVIKSRTFVPRKGPRNPDTRELGIPFVKLSFVRETD